MGTLNDLELLLVITKTDPNSIFSISITWRYKLEDPDLMFSENWKRELISDFRTYIDCCILKYTDEPTEFTVSVCSNLWMDDIFERAIERWNIVLLGMGINMIQMEREPEEGNGLSKFDQKVEI